MYDRCGEFSHGGGAGAVIVGTDVVIAFDYKLVTISRFDEKKICYACKWLKWLFSVLTGHAMILYS